MAGYDCAGFIDKYWTVKSKFFDARRDLMNLFSGVSARVPRIGFDIADWLH
jgi:hypothetical protein